MKQVLSSHLPSGTAANLLVVFVHNCHELRRMLYLVSMAFVDTAIRISSDMSMNLRKVLVEAQHLITSTSLAKLLLNTACSEEL